MLHLHNEATLCFSSSCLSLQAAFQMSVWGPKHLNPLGTGMHWKQPCRLKTGLRSVPIQEWFSQQLNLAFAHLHCCISATCSGERDGRTQVRVLPGGAHIGSSISVGYSSFPFFFRLKSNTESSDAKAEAVADMYHTNIRVAQTLLTKHYCCVVFYLWDFSSVGKKCFWTEIICVSLRSWAAWKTCCSNSNIIFPRVFLLSFASCFLMLFIHLLSRAVLAIWNIFTAMKQLNLLGLISTTN